MDINNKLHCSDVLTMMGFLYLKKKKLIKAKKANKRAKKILRKLKGSYRNIRISKLAKAIEGYEE